MTTPIRSYPESQRDTVIRRRLNQSGVRGLGYFSAVDAMRHVTITPRMNKPVAKQQRIEKLQGQSSDIDLEVEVDE